MKKITTTIFVTFLSIICYCQSASYKITKTTYLVYNDYWREWTSIDSTYPTEMYAFFDKKKIKITDRSHSNYIVYGEPEIETKDDHTTYTWKAIDEEQRECNIMLERFFDYNKYYYDKSYLFVMYSKTAFLYLIEKEK